MGRPEGSCQNRVMENVCNPAVHPEQKNGVSSPHGLTCDISMGDMPYCTHLSDKGKEACNCVSNRLTESRSPGSGSTWPPPSSPSILVGLSNPLKSSFSKASSSSLELSAASVPSLLCLKRLSPPAAILQIDETHGLMLNGLRLFQLAGAMLESI